MIIEDQELRGLFKSESEEHLQLLDEGLLRLEANPTDIGILEELFRSAHSLKGAARMLGLEDVEKVTHWFESVLGSAKDRAVSLTSDTVSRMYHSVSVIQRLVSHALTGEPSGVDVEQVLRWLDDKGVTASPETAAAGAVSERSETDSPELSSGSHKLPTIRVEQRKLDALMTHAGELIVTKTRLVRRTGQLDELISLWEECNRSRQGENIKKFADLLHILREDIGEDTARLDYTVSRVDEGVRDVRLLPLSTVFNVFRRMVRDIAKAQNKAVQLVIQGGDTVADKRILEEMKDPIMHMIRNAVDHGIEPPAEREARGKPRTGTIRLAASARGSNIILELSDDGRGLNEDSIKATALKRKVASQEELARMTTADVHLLIFRSGFSTSTVITDISGRGVGMDVVRTNVEGLKGSIAVESVEGAGCTVRIQLPATLATSRALLVGLGRQNYVLPVEHVHSTRVLAPEEIVPVSGRQSILVDDRPIPVVRLSDLLELPPSGAKPDAAGSNVRQLSCVIVAAGKDPLALIVDELLDEQEVILQPLGGLLKRVPNVSGSAILVTGAVSIVLNPTDLIRSAAKRTSQAIAALAPAQEQRKARVLLVEDSITTRTWEKRGLESAGFEVVAAVDGIEALQKLGEQTFDAVVSDVEMPRMDGLTLAGKIRQDKRNAELPVILVTSLANDEDKKRGVEAGANAYITKPAFDQKLLVETVRRLI